MFQICEVAGLYFIAGLLTLILTSQGTPSPVASQPHPSDYDPNNTTLFIGGLSSGVSEDDLRVLFGRFGDIVYTKIPPGKGCGFVQFVQRPAAETAMAQMQVCPPFRLANSRLPYLLCIVLAERRRPRDRWTCDELRVLLGLL